MDTHFSLSNLFRAISLEQAQKLTAQFEASLKKPFGSLKTSITLSDGIPSFTTLYISDEEINLINADIKQVVLDDFSQTSQKQWREAKYISVRIDSIEQGNSSFATLRFKGLRPRLASFYAQVAKLNEGDLQRDLKGLNPFMLFSDGYTGNSHCSEIPAKRILSRFNR